jgi:hypothetical protein
VEQHSIDLNDPIGAKLRDSATLDRLVRQAVAEAVERARKLGFLEGEDNRKHPTGLTTGSRTLKK